MRKLGGDEVGSYLVPNPFFWENVMSKFIFSDAGLCNSISIRLKHIEESHLLIG